MDVEIKMRNVYVNGLCKTSGLTIMVQVYTGPSKL